MSESDDEKFGVRITIDQALLDLCKALNVDMYNLATGQLTDEEAERIVAALEPTGRIH